MWLGFLAYFYFMQYLSGVPPTTNYSRELQRPELHLRMLPLTQARCLDGSPGGYYFAPATSSSTTKKWVIFLEGGGACFDFSTCHDRSKTTLGSSLQWPRTRVDESNVLSTDEGINPLWSTWNRVFIPYCTGDVHSGQQSQKDLVWNAFYFSGARNVQAILADLSQKQHLREASHILFAGLSAGGLGVLLHGDELASTLIDPQAQVKLLIQGAWFFPDVVTYKAFLAHPLGDWNASSALAAMGSRLLLLWHSRLPGACVAAHPTTPHLCASFHFAYPFLKCPIYVIQNRLDTNQIYSQLGCCGSPSVADHEHSYLQYFGQKMDLSLGQIIQNQNKKDGLFLMNRAGHTENVLLNSSVTISGHLLSASLMDWFEAKGDQPWQLIE